MMTCKQVSTLLSAGELAGASLSRRLAVRLHLMMCDHCSAFDRWLNAIAAGVRALSRVVERESPADLESRVLRRLDRSAP